VAARIRMIHILGAAIALVLSFTYPISLCAAQLDEQQSSAQDTKDSNAAPAHIGQISGHVYRADNGVPITKAVVTIKRSPGWIDAPMAPQSALTAGDGSFFFANLPPGIYEFWAHRQGFITQYGDAELSVDGKQSFRLYPSRDREFGDVVLRFNAAGLISGKVLDEDGDPVMGIKVSAVRPTYNPGGSVDISPDKDATTNDLGEYRLTELDCGNYFVRAGGSEETTGSIQAEDSWNYFPSYYPGAPRMDTAVTIHVAAGTEAHGIDLHVASATKKAYAIVVTVAGRSQFSKRTGFEIGLIAGDEIADEQRNNFEWLEDGSFLIQGVSPGRYTILATSFDPDQPFDGNRSSRLGYGVAAVTVDDKNVRAAVNLGKSGIVRGRVVLDGPHDSSQEDLHSSNIYLDAETGIGAVKDESENKMESNGEFTLDSLSPGKYWVHVSFGEKPEYLKQILCGDKDYTLQPIEIEVGTSMSCQINIGTDAGTITGQVMGEGKPVPKYSVVAIPDLEALRKVPYFSNDRITNASGQFEFTGVAPGDYLLFAVPYDRQQGFYAIDFADRNLRDAVRVTVTAGETKTLTLKPTNPM
jgi:hypothetical protein